MRMTHSYKIALALSSNKTVVSFGKKDMEVVDVFLNKNAIDQ